MKREKNITIMKISKVNHRRTAVALNGDKSELGGILYEAPVQKDKNGNYNDVIAETGKVVNEALDKKSRLYTPFNNQKVIIDKKLQRYANNLKRCYINFVKQYVNNKSVFLIILIKTEMRISMNNKQFCLLHQFLNKAVSLLIVFIIVITLSGCSLPWNQKQISETTISATEDNADFTEYVNNLFADLLSADMVSLHAYVEQPVC